MHSSMFTESLANQNKQYRILYVPTGEFCGKARGFDLACTRHYLRLLDSHYSDATFTAFVAPKNVCVSAISNMCDQEFVTVEEFELVEVSEDLC